jgi:thiosulfate/3-mercaptopyruvate sulfurtransferase
MISRKRIPLILVLTIALVYLAAPGRAESPPAPATEKAMGTLVTAEWLSEHLGEPGLVVLDCTIVVEMKEGGGFRSLSGREVYEESHIPTAAFADLKGALSDTDSDLQFALPTPEAFCEVMGKLGVGDQTRVVVYDRMMSVWASRVWWMLRWVGFDNVAVLDGGWGAWVAEERPQSAEPATYEPRKLTPHLRPELVADRDEVFSALEDEGVTLVDAMPAAHYKGQMALYDRPGHIPGAVNISPTELLDEDGHFKPREGLAEVITEDRKGRYIIYCGSGISASGVAFAMTELGFTDVAVYTASLQEWAADEANPLVVEGD